MIIPKRFTKATMNDNNVLVEDVTFKELDVDGVVAIGSLPLVKPSSLSTKPKININNIKPAYFNLNSLGDARKDYENLHSYHVGYVGGMPYNWLTDLDPRQLKDLILDFLADHQPEHLGMENHWVKSWGNGEHNDILHAMNLANSFDVIVTPAFLTHFSNYVSQIRVFGAITWYGCKQDLAAFTSSLDHINQDQVLVSCIHVGLELKKPGYLLGIRQAPSHTNNKYHPLGLDYFTNFSNDSEGALVNFGLEDLVEDFGLTTLRVYHPQLAHTRPSYLRLKEDNRGIIAASAMLGSGALVQGGAYKKLAEQAAHLKACLKGALNYRSLSDSTLRLEFVIKDIFVNFNDQIDDLRRAIIDFRPRLLPNLGEIEITSIDLDGGINQALQTLDNPNASIPKVAAAEAYLIYLVDGGTLRLFYNGLIAALGSSLSNALSSLVQKHQYVKLGNDFDRLSWGNCDYMDNYTMRRNGFIEQFSQAVKDKWKVSDPRVVMRVIAYYSSKCESTDIIKLIRDLEIFHLGKSSDNFLTSDHIKKTDGLAISMCASTLDVLDCVLHTRSQKGIRALSAAMLRTFLEARGEVDTEKRHLANYFNTDLMNRLHFDVWPHSLPVSQQDRRSRFWKLRLEKHEDSFLASWALFQERCPRSRDRLTLELSYESSDQIVARAWHCLSNWINAHKNEHHLLQTVENTGTFRLVWVIVIMCVCHRNKRDRHPNDIRHPRFDWPELWTKIPSIGNILNWMKARDLVQAVPPNTPLYGTLLDHVIVPRDFIVRLRNLDEPTPPPSPTPDNELPHPIQGPDDNTHNDPEVMEVADDDQLQNQPLLDPQEQPPTPDPAPS